MIIGNLQHNYHAELCIHWHKLQLSHPWICYEQLDSGDHFCSSSHLQVNRCVGKYVLDNVLIMCCIIRGSYANL